MREVLNLRSSEYFLVRTYQSRCLYSIAAPGTSQHIAMLAFDANEFLDQRVREILAAAWMVFRLSSAICLTSPFSACRKPNCQAWIEGRRSNGQKFWHSGCRVKIDWHPPFADRHLKFWFRICPSLRHQLHRSSISCYDSFKHLQFMNKQSFIVDPSRCFCRRRTGATGGDSIDFFRIEFPRKDARRTASISRNLVWHCNPYARLIIMMAALDAAGFDPTPPERAFGLSQTGAKRIR